MVPFDSLSKPEAGSLRHDPVVSPSKPRLLGILGPGLITGASDDDPSGIATYSQAGAQIGFDGLWIMLFSYPLMAVTQEISARIGRTTGRGLAGTFRHFYPPWLVQSCILLLLAANVINLGADLGAMGDTGESHLELSDWTRRGLMDSCPSSPRMEDGNGIDLDKSGRDAGAS